jgi:hypothetical protein
MTSKEIYETRRTSFIKKVQLYFAFLVSEFNFEKPTHRYSQQKNGTIISDELIFESKKLNKSLSISNSYHPVDYGFEINLIDKEKGQKDMLHFVLKENQDLKQNYLKEVAESLRISLGKND